MKKRMVTDCLMVVMLPLLMAYSLVGETLHEFFGLFMFALFIAHHILNRSFFKSFTKGSYSITRVINTLLDVLLLADMLAMMVSGIIISKYALVFLNIRGGAAFGRIIHMLGAYWGFVFMTMHLGFHGSLMGGRIGLLKDRKRILAARAVIFPAAAWGIFAAVKRDFFDYLFAKSLFVFFDESEPLVLFILDYVCIMILFATAAFYLLKLLQRAGRRPDKKKELTKRGGSKADDNEGKMSGKKKKKWIITCVLTAVLAVLVTVFGIPYFRRHFITVNIDRALATAMAKTQLKGSTLVISFTRVGNTDFDPDVDATSSASLMLDEGGNLVGNAELIAEMIKNSTGAQTAAILVKEASRYPSSYSATVSVASDELSGKIMPKIRTDMLPDIAPFDNIIFVYPIWWGTLPKAVEVFINEYDWTGKNVWLVVTHGGSEAGSCPKDMARLMQGAVLSENVLTIYDDDADEAAAKVYGWLKSVGQEQ